VRRLLKNQKYSSLEEEREEEYCASLVISVSEEGNLEYAREVASEQDIVLNEKDTIKCNTFVVRF